MDRKRTCMACGRLLEIGETCHCQQPVSGRIPKDGLRARCPNFRHRSCYRMQSYIVCGGDRIRFASRETRNDHYRDYCCGDWQTCVKHLKGRTQQE